jgi:hypothetical protein
MTSTGVTQAAALILALLLVGCAGTPKPVAQSCPKGQDYLHTARLFLGRSADARPAVSEAEFNKFVASELTPRFPNGLTVIDGGERWRGSGDRLVREAQKVVLIVLPSEGEASKRIAAVRDAYKARFHQDSVLLVGQAACVSF